MSWQRGLTSLGFLCGLQGGFLHTGRPFYDLNLLSVPKEGDYLASLAACTDVQRKEEWEGRLKSCQQSNTKKKKKKPYSLLQMA